MAEVNLLENYPKTKRNLEKRAKKTAEQIKIARKFDKEFFDGDRKVGYGGFNYHPKFWSQVVQDFIKYYDLDSHSSILDVGCAKGFMLYDFKQALPAIKVMGIDISVYAIENAIDSIKSFVSVGVAQDLSLFNDNAFDLVVSINTVHNLPVGQCVAAIQEIDRVGKNSFITVDAWSNPEEEQKMRDWNLTASTMMSTANWTALFKDINYAGDHYWFLP